MSHVLQICVFASLFCAAWLYAYWGLLDGRSSTRLLTLSKLSFSVIFAAGVHAHFLIFDELLLETLDSAHRHAYWKMDLVLECVFGLIIVPYSFFWSLSPPHVSRHQLASKIVFATVLFCTAIFVVSRAGEVESISSTHTLLDACVSRLSVAGVVGMAVLSGFGAVSTPFTFVRRLSPNVSQQAIETASERLLETCEIVASRKRDAQRHRGRRRGRSPLRRMRGTVATKSPTRKKADEDDEDDVAALVSVMQSMYVDLDALCKRRAWKEKRESFRLRDLTYEIFGWGMAAYALVKTGFTMRNVGYRKGASETDPISRTLGWVLPDSFPHRESVARFLPFAFVTILVFSSVRGFLLTARRVFTQYDRSSNALRPSTLVLALAEVSCLNLTASLVLMRSNLPQHARHGLTRALGSDLGFDERHQLFDAAFLLSVFVSLAVKVFEYRTDSLEANSNDAVAAAKFDKVL